MTAGGGAFPKESTAIPGGHGGSNGTCQPFVGLGLSGVPYSSSVSSLRQARPCGDWILAPGPIKWKQGSTWTKEVLWKRMPATHDC